MTIQTTTSAAPTTETPTLSIRPALYERLFALAAREGRPVEEVADELLTETLARHERVEVDTDKPHAGMTFAQILAPVAEDFKASGMTDEELGDFIDAEIEAHRAERRAREGTETEAAEQQPTPEPSIVLGRRDV